MMTQKQLRTANSVLLSLREEFPKARLRLESDAVILMHNGCMIAGLRFHGWRMDAVETVPTRDEFSPIGERAIRLYRGIIGQ